MRWNLRNILVSAGVVLGLTFVLLNVVSYAALIAVFHVNVYGKSYETYRRAALLDNSRGTLPHPYFGKLELYAQQFESRLATEPMFHRVDRLGGQDEIVVLLLGGSVAEQMSSYRTAAGHGLFAATLNARFGTDRFTVYNAGMGGGKQPQQYFKLVYLDLLGFKPDIVINYDGFNELALPLSENADLGNPVIFPRAYSAHLEASSSAVRACTAGSNRLMRSNSGIPVAELIAVVYAERCRARILRPIAPSWWQAYLPREDATDLARRSRDIWRESSNRLFEFTRVRGIDYLHVLQPNQYLPGAKILSEQERREFINRPRYGEHVRLHYGAFSREGLNAVNFRDQRYLFKDNAETLYNDDCCHFNEKGIQYLADDIISAFHDVFGARLRKGRPEGAVVR
jgi:hypothetical protein